MKLEMILATVDTVYSDTVGVGKCMVLNSVLDFDPLHLVVAPRHALDKTHEWSHARQLIPYILVMNEEGKILTYSRTKQSGEERLHNSVSVGWGGHIDMCDFVTSDSRILLQETILDSAFRELNEELGINIQDCSRHEASAPGVEPKYALIISDEDDVGRVHLGLVYKVVIKGDMVFDTEDTGKIIGWKTVEEALALGDALEGWTTALLTRMNKKDMFVVPALY